MVALFVVAPTATAGETYVAKRDVQMQTATALFKFPVDAMRGERWELVKRTMQNQAIILILLALLTTIPAFAQDINSELKAAAQNGQAEKVQALLEAGADVNAKDENGMTPLMWGGDAETVQVLLDAGAKVNAKDDRGFTPLIHAAWDGGTEIVKVLLDGGANINAQDNYAEETALMKAAEKGHTEAVEALIKAGADINAKSFEEPKRMVHVFRTASWGGSGTALLYATGNGHPEIVKILLQAGADVNQKARMDGSTLLKLAKQLGHTEIIELLKNARRDRGRTGRRRR